VKPEHLSEGDDIACFIKNFQSVGVYCALNIGCSGLVTEKESVYFLITHSRIGDLVFLEVAR
jgi:hypothetical protein